MIHAILFDFNGVIIDDEPLQMKSYQEVLRTTEGITLTEADYYASLGMDDRTFVRTTFARAGKELDDKHLRAVIEEKSVLHRQMIEGELPLFPGVETFIKAARREFALGVVSMARLVEIEHVLERAKLAEAFSVVVSAEDVSVCKPDPACYKLGFKLLDAARYAAGKMSMTPDECLAIEDAPPGIRAARAAGLRTLGVTNTVDAAALRAAGADVVTASLADWTMDALRHVFGSRWRHT